MTRTFFTAVALAALLPTVALAQETCEQRATNQAIGTVAGAAGGALIGGAVAGHGEKGTGALVGAVAGGVIGNQLARGPRDCAHAYGWYDSDGRWHANAVDRDVAYGYYDRGGVWVDGEPSGYYSQEGAWVAQPVVTRNPDETDWLGYPEFRDQDAHIRGEIVGAVREDEIAADDAQDLMRRLGDIEVREAIAFRDHGWRLADYDRSRIRGDLDQLDRDVDRVRREP